MPREWPPVSVWLAGLAVAGYPTGLAAYLYWTGDRRWEVMSGFAGCLVCTACGLVVRIPSTPLRNCTPPAHHGWVIFLAYVAAGLATSFFGFIGLLTLASASEFAGPQQLRQLGAGLRFAGAGAMTGLLLWWPETRRWCGLLPPADPED